MTQNSISNTGSILDVDNIRVDSNSFTATDTDGNLVIAPDGTGVVSVTAAPLIPSGDRAEDLGSSSSNWKNVYADGLSFDDGTNVMASYVGETSWTPTIVGVTTPGVGTYTTQVGSYVRIGNLIYLTYNLDWSAHTGTGAMRIGGVPISIASPTLNAGSCQAFNGFSPLANTLFLANWGNGAASTDELIIQGQNTAGNLNAPLVESNQAVGIRGSLIYITS